MGKKQNKEGKSSDVKTPPVNAVQNRDIMQRMNFLWQASVYLENLAGGSGALERGKGREMEGEGERRRKKKKRRVKERMEGKDLARVYIETMKSVGQKTTTKMDPGVKRTICKGCSSILVPGVSARVRVRPSGPLGHCISYTCLECSTTRRIPAPRNVQSQPSIPDPSTSITPIPIEAKSRSTDAPDAHTSRLPDVTRREPTDEAATTRLTRHEIKKKRKVVVRQQPVFARRSEGHVVFRGVEPVDMEGVYCA